MCLWQRQIFDGHRIFQHFYHVTSLKSINIVFETGKYHSWHNTLPFRVGYWGANTRTPESDPSTHSSPISQVHIFDFFCWYWNGTMGVKPYIVINIWWTPVTNAWHWYSTWLDWRNSLFLVRNCTDTLLRGRKFLLGTEWLVSLQLGTDACYMRGTLLTWTLYFGIDSTLIYSTLNFIL